MNFQINDSVVVKAGIEELDTGINMGGWQGRVTKIEEENILCIEWDSLTLKKLPDSYIKNSEQEGLDWSQYYIYATDLEKTEPSDTEDDVEEIIDIIKDKHAWDHLGKEGIAISEVLQDIPSDDDDAALAAWDKHLRQVLTFPFEAQITEFQERGPLRTGDILTVESIDSYVDEVQGLLVNVKKKRSRYDFPLADIEAVDTKGSNFQPVKNYAIWFANH